MRGWSARAPRRRAKLGLLLLPQRGSPPCTKVRMSPRRQRPQAAQTQTRPSWSAWMQVQIWPICDFFPLPVVEIMSNLNLLLFFFFSGSMLRRWDLVTRAKSLMRTTLLRWTTYRYSSQSCVRCVKTNSKNTKQKRSVKMQTASILKAEAWPPPPWQKVSDCTMCLCAVNIRRSCRRGSWRSSRITTCR